MLALLALNKVIKLTFKLFAYCLCYCQFNVNKFKKKSDADLDFPTVSTLF